MARHLRGRWLATYSDSLTHVRVHSAATTPNRNRFAFQENTNPSRVGMIFMVAFPLQCDHLNHPNFASLQSQNVPHLSVVTRYTNVELCWSNAEIKVTVNDSKISPLLPEMDRMLFNTTCTPI